MRGDSRLDFYAKSLALAGLGLVGAVGALIDYWPASTRLPVAEAGMRRPATAVRSMVGVRELGPVEPVRAVPAAMTAARLERRVGSDGAEHQTKFSVDAWYDNAVGTTSQDVAGLPVSDFALTAALPSVSLVGDAEPSAADPTGTDATVLFQPLAPPVLAVDRSDEGFFSGMLRKTSSSVSSSLGKASDSVIGAVRAVGGVVKRAF